MWAPRPDQQMVASEGQPPRFQVRGSSGRLPAYPSSLATPFQAGYTGIRSVCAGLPLIRKSRATLNDILDDCTLKTSTWSPRGPRSGLLRRALGPVGSCCNISFASEQCAACAAQRRPLVWSGSWCLSFRIGNARPRHLARDHRRDRTVITLSSRADRVHSRSCCSAR
jgi:hypothetical protein